MKPFLGSGKCTVYGKQTRFHDTIVTREANFSLCPELYLNYLSMADRVMLL